MHIKIWRLALCAVATTAALALSSSSAMAAGTPIITLPPATALSFNEGQVSGTVNPNGAATTYRIEYGPKFENVAAEGSIGSGEVAVPVVGRVKGLDPNSSTAVRISATNKYGTIGARGGHINTPFWIAYAPLHEYSFPETYSSSGTLTIKQYGGPAATITCAEQGHGTITSSGAGEYNSEFTGCAIEGSSCVVLAAPLHLNANFGSSSVWSFEIKKCPGNQLEEFVLTPFEVVMPPAGNRVSQPVTLKGETKFGFNPVVITLETQLKLSGAGAGLPFGWGS